MGRTLARIHALRRGAAGDWRPQFDTDAIFFDIRLEPYLLATAQRHPDLAPQLRALVQRTRRRTKRTLVHGDVSPKNILVGGHTARCCWTPNAPGRGDPAFDLAFCLNHLLLKCLWTPAARAGFLACFDGAGRRPTWRGVDWEPRDALERRAAALLPGLLLARVDGKSPVEYLVDEAQRDTVRRVARALLARPVRSARRRGAAWRRELER